jgi:hypothetical protein
MAKKLSLSQVLDELDVMNDSDSGSEFEDDTELDADDDVNFDNSGDSDSGNDTDVHDIQDQGQGGTKKCATWEQTVKMVVVLFNIFLLKIRSY